jgi:hypothetical protein
MAQVHLSMTHHYRESSDEYETYEPIDLEKQSPYISTKLDQNGNRVSLSANNHEKCPVGALTAASATALIVLKLDPGPVNEVNGPDIPSHRPEAAGGRGPIR